METFPRLRVTSQHALSLLQTSWGRHWPTGQHHGPDLL